MNMLGFVKGTEIKGSACLCDLTIYIPGMPSFKYSHSYITVEFGILHSYF